MDLERNPMPMGNRPALILVDMINGFTDGTCPLGSDCPEVVAANRILLDTFRAAGMSVFFTTVVYHNDNQASVFRGRINALNLLTPDSDWVKVDSRLAPIGGEPLIEKQWASAFFGTDLDQQLKSAGIDCIVVTGLTTSGCVRATVVDGLQCNFPVFVPREAVGDRNMEAHSANLHDMHAKYADVIGVADVVSHLQGL